MLAFLVRFRLAWPGWPEAQLFVLLAIVIGTYFTRLGDLSLRGEETRRARVAIEMLESGDWIVPREQGRLFPDRPPLGNWLIALSMLATGSTGTVAVRLPTVLATLATTLIVYGYSRRFLSAHGALAAGLAYATMGQVLSLGMLAETEATFTLFVGASLLVWHAAYGGGWWCPENELLAVEARNVSEGKSAAPLAYASGFPHVARRGPAAVGLPRWQTWCLGYVLAGLAALAKGPQGPIYFIGATTVYLAVRRDWRSWLSWSHLLGVIVGGAVVAAWQVPYSRAVEWPLVLQTWGHTSVARFDYSSAWPVLAHLVSFPCEIAGCLLPWSPLLAAFCLRGFLRTLSERERGAVIFLTIAIGVAFPTCWFAPQARGRYFMPLYPCFAPLIGIAVEHAWSSGAMLALRKFWQRYLTCATAVVLAGGIVVTIATFTPWLQTTPFHQSAATAICYLVSVLALAAVMWRTRLLNTATYAVSAVVAVALFTCLTLNGIVMNDFIRRSDDIAGQVAALKERLPPDVRLVSFGRAHHPFVYYYGETIPWLDWPKLPEAAAEHEYFCFHSMRGRRKPLPFAWEEIAVVRCDRYLRREPVDAMIVGRRLHETASPASSTFSSTGGGWGRAAASGQAVR